MTRRRWGRASVAQRGRPGSNPGAGSSTLKGDDMSGKRRQRGGGGVMDDKILAAMNEAEQKAWEALSGYKFWMLGYHAARWINYNKLLDKSKPNPFRDAVNLGRQKIDNLGEDKL